MKRRVILAAGHGGGDSGAVAQGTTEATETIQITSKVVNLLRADGQLEVVLVPDALGLADTIAWINARYKSIDDGICSEIHKNSGGGTGTEVWTPSYPDATSKSQAKKVADSVARHTGLPNRGVKEAQNNRWGRLGFCDDTNTYALLIEANFIDKDSISDDADNKVARGIAEGLLNCFGLNWKPTTPPVPPVTIVKTESYNPAKTFVVTAATHLVTFPGGANKSGSQLYSVGAKVSDVVEKITYSNGLSFYRTKYARDTAKAFYGFRDNTMREYVAPTPAEPAATTRTLVNIYDPSRKMVINYDTTLVEIPSGKPLATKFKAGDIIEHVGDYQEFSNGRSFYRTTYSAVANKNSGFDKAALKDYVEPKAPVVDPVPTPPTKDEEQDARLTAIEKFIELVKQFWPFSK